MFSKKPFRNFFLIIAAVLLLIFFNSRGWLELPRNLVFGAGRPFISVFQTAGDFLADNLSFLLTIGDLGEENQALKNENLELLKNNVALKEKARENDFLRARLGLSTEREDELILSRVAGFDSEIGQYLLIDKGEKDGVKKGMAAVTAENFLVGKVAEASANFSKVLLIFDQNSVVNAILQETRSGGVVKGSHGLTLFLEMIPIDKEIKKDEFVLTSGLDDSLPAGLILGRVSEIISKENEIFQRAIVASPIDLKNLEKVFVIKRTGL